MRTPIDALFARFATANLRLRGPAAPIPDARGELAGHLDEIELSGGSLRVSGWVRAEQVTLLAAGQECGMRPDLHREDVSAAHGGSPAVGFSVSVPFGYQALCESDPPGLVFRGLGGTPLPEVTIPLRPPARTTRWRLRLRFAAALLKALPAGLRWRLTGDHLARARVKNILGIRAATAAVTEIDAATLAATGAPAAPRGATPGMVTVVMPVYNAYDLLEEVLDRAIRHTDLPFRLLLIEDRSTDPRVRPFLRAFGAHHRENVRVLENESNLGFIGSVNRAFGEVLGEPGGGPVILLNSDAFVPEGWASRLVAPLLAEADIASVTPMSNDAEIVSAPAVCRPHSLAAGQADAIDRQARRLGAGLPVEVPTGVGFCMAIDRSWLRRMPRFDTGFGRGYGEEVDWCQKTRALGARHVALPSLFVEHRGGGSFGSDAKREMVARNNAVIARRYPDYDRQVQEFIATDPLLTPRLALGIAWAGSVSDAAVPVYLAHSLGGGADHYLEDRIAADRAAGRPAIVLRVGGPRRWQVELRALDGGVTGCTDDIAVVRRLLDGLPRRRIVYSCGVGDPDPLSLPEHLLSLATRPDDAVEILFHDFFPLSPSYTLLDADGVYRGPPGPGRADRAHRIRRPDGADVSLAKWQAGWLRLAAAAEELRVFSRDSAAILSAVWPDLADRVRVRPHRLRRTPGRVAARGGRPVIGVLGNVNLQKGAGVVQALARQLGGQAAPEAGLVVIGNVDPAFALPGWVPVTGTYAVESLPALARSHGVTHWLIPSIWPETFSFTTHEALATGLPVMVFDLGAQAEAAGRSPNGIVLDLSTGAAGAATILAALAPRTELKSA